MSARARSALRFGLRFLPLFALLLWAYPKILPAYERLVLGAANACLAVIAPRVELSPGAAGFVTARIVRPGGRVERLPDLSGYRALDVFAQLPLVLALLLATPMRPRSLFARSLAGLGLMFALHVAAVAVLFSAWSRAQSVPHSPVIDWMGVVAMTSGQVGAFVVWGLLTWTFWLSLSQAPAHRVRLGKARGMQSEGAMSDPLKAAVRERYAAAAKRAADGGQAACGEASACCGSPSESNVEDPITSGLYDETQQAQLPAAALRASLGCGNPTALAELRPGEVVLDLGSGGGIDVILSARRVGPEGKAYGLDMTDEMLALARRNQAESGVSNVEFLKGEIEAIPLPDATVDVVISNCVINLSGDKDRVLAESYRVLKPGGRFAVSDVVVRGEVPSEVRRSMELWVGCVAGALEESDYRRRLERAGFVEVSIEPTRVYRVADAREFLRAQGIDPEAVAPQVDGKFRSAFIRARKAVRPLVAEAETR